MIIIGLKDLHPGGSRYQTLSLYCHSGLFTKPYCLIGWQFIQNTKAIIYFFFKYFCLNCYSAFYPIKWSFGLNSRIHSSFALFKRLIVWAKKLIFSKMKFVFFQYRIIQQSGTKANIFQKSRSLFLLTHLLYASRVDGTFLESPNWVYKLVNSVVGSYSNVQSIILFNLNLNYVHEIMRDSNQSKMTSGPIMK